MVTWLRPGYLVLTCALLVGACSSPSAEVLAAEQLIEQQLADSLGLVLDATCQEPNPPTVITCTATTPDGAQVLVTGTVGADELELHTTNVLTGAQIDAAVDAFRRATESASLPEGTLDCGTGPVVTDASGVFECRFVGESDNVAPVTVTADGLDRDDVNFSFEVELGAAIAAEGTIERVILPELGFEGIRAVCTATDADSEPFSCGAVLDDGRVLEFVAFDDQGTVQVAAANVLAPDELAKLDVAFAETVAAAGLSLPDGRLDCGADTVILDTTATFVCSYVAVGQVAIEVTVTAIDLGSPGARFDFTFAERS